MQKVPEISIIVSIYNIEKYVQCCLKSIAGQFFTDFEAILVDDGSTDKSGQICDAFAASDSRFMVIHQENKGLSQARNVGMDAAKGNWIAIIDGDDYLHPGALQELHRMAMMGADLSICSYRSVIEDNDSAFEDQAEGTASVIKTLPLDDFLSRLCIDLKVIFIWNKLYRRSMISDIRFRDRVGEDRDFNYQVGTRCNPKILTTSFKGNAYRNRPSSISRTEAVPFRLRVYQDRCNSYNIYIKDYPSESVRGRTLKGLMDLMLKIRWGYQGTEWESDAKVSAENMKSMIFRDFLSCKAIPVKYRIMYPLCYYNRFIYKVLKH